MTEQELLKQALAAMEIADEFCGSHTAEECSDHVHIPITDALKAIRAHLAQPVEQEPVAELLEGFITKRELCRLLNINPDDPHCGMDYVLWELEGRLSATQEAPAQEPAATPDANVLIDWIHAGCPHVESMGNRRIMVNHIRRISAPPQRKPLTDEEIEQCVYTADSACTTDACTAWFIEFARAIEAAHGIGSKT